jgi:prophage regulatory protein
MQGADVRTHQHFEVSMNVIVKPDNVYLSVDQVAERYGLSADTIWRWKRNGKFPASVRIGPNCTRWRMSDLIEHESRFQASFAMSAEWMMAA